MGGELAVESQPGAGTEFRLTLPAARPVAPLSEPAPEALHAA